MRSHGAHVLPSNRSHASSATRLKSFRGADDACLHLRDARRRKALRFCAPPHGLVTAVWRA